MQNSRTLQKLLQGLGRHICIIKVCNSCRVKSMYAAKYLANKCVRTIHMMFRQNSFLDRFRIDPSCQLHEAFVAHSGHNSIKFPFETHIVFT